MKRLLTIVVASAATTTAYAETSVQLYGIADMAVVYTKDRTIGATRLGLESGGKSGSRFGLKGVEDLGDGLKALFKLENGYELTNGMESNNGRLFGREAWVGLANDIGTLAAGRIASFGSGTGSFNMWGRVDPFGTSYGLASTNSLFASGAMRLDNTILVQSRNFSGFQMGALYSFSATAGAPAEEEFGPHNNNRVIGLAVSYSAGPLYLMSNLDIVKPAHQSAGPMAGVSPETETHLKFGGVYDFGLFKLHAAYERERNLTVYSKPRNDLLVFDTLDPRNRPDADVYMVGFTVPINGSSKVFGSFQYRNGKPFTVSTDSTYEADEQIISVGYLYELSKRTDLYAVVADARGKKSLSKDSDGTGASNRTDVRIGISHSF